MSRKSKKNPSQPVNPPPPPAPAAQPSAPAAGPMNRRNVFIVAVVALLLAFVAATLSYRSQQAQSSQLAAARNQPALASAQSPSFGKSAAQVHIVEFFDPACETCALFFPHVKQLMSANPDRIRLSLRHVPFHPGSDLVVGILEAARNQDKYLPVLEALYASQDRWVVNHVVQQDRVWASLGGVGLDLERLRNDMNAPDLAQRMAQDMADARVLGVTKTPEFFVNGRPMPRFGLDEFRNLVAEELRRAYP